MEYQKDIKERKTWTNHDDKTCKKGQDQIIGLWNVMGINGKEEELCIEVKK